MIVTALAVAGLLGAVNTPDPPIVPIEPELLEIGFALPEADGLCANYGGSVALIPALGLEMDLQLIFLDMIDAYFVVTLEESFGGNSRLTDEAREVFVDWLHSCA
jgi:hypothetical protein